MKKIIFLLIGIAISFNVQSQCTGVTVRGTAISSTYKSCHDTVLVNSCLKKVTADSLTIANYFKITGLSSGIIKNTGGVFSTASSTDLPVMTSTTSGAVPTPPNNTTTFLRGDGTFATPTGGGSISTVSVVNANGFAGTVANATTTPAITISTTITGIVKGNGATISTATSGTDYSLGTSSNTTGIVKSTTGTGALTTAVVGDFPTLNQNTTGTANNITGTTNGTLTTLSALSLPGSQVTGNIAGSAATLTTPRTIATTGDVNYTSPGFNGSSNVTATSTVTWVNGKPTYDTTYTFKLKTITKSANYTAIPGDFVACTNTSGSFTITLPAAPMEGARVGAKLTVQGGTNTISIVTSGSDVFNKISGGTSLTLSLLNQAINLQYNHSIGVWYVVGDNLSLSSLDSRYVTPSGSITGTANTITSSPDYFYTGSQFYKSRVGNAFQSPFPNNSNATNTPTNMVFIGDSRFDFNVGVLVDLIGQYDKLNSLGFISFHSGNAAYGSDCAFVNTGTTATLTHNDVTSNASWGVSGGRADCPTGTIYTITPVSKYRFDSFQLWYNRTSGGGSFTYTIDGGSATTVNTTAISDSLGTLTVNTGLATGGSHTIVLTVTSGSVRLYGIDFYNKAQAGYCVHVLNSGGSRASDWDGHNLYTKQFIAVKNPITCTVWLGTNDAGELGAGSTASVYIGHIKNIISQLKLPVMCAPILISDPQRGLSTNNAAEDTATTTLLKSYRTALIQAVKDSGYSLFDVQSYWPVYSYGWPNGMYSDRIHPSSGGSCYTWSGLVRAIMPTFNNENVSGILEKRRTSVLVPNDGVTGFGSVTLASNGIQSENFTGHYFPSNSQMIYKSGNVTQLAYSLGTALITAYPTSGASQILFGYRQGSTSAKAFDFTVNSDGSTSITTNNSYVATSATSSRFSSKIYVGGIATTPTASVHIAAGTATAGTAPLKLTSGTNLTTVEDGAVEYDGSKYYHSVSTTRYESPRMLIGSLIAFDFPSIAANSVNTTTVTVTGAADGDACFIGATNAASNTVARFSCRVSATNTVTIEAANINGLTAVDPASGNFQVRVIK